MNNSIREANSERHYLLLVVAIIIGLLGVYVRFIEALPHASAIANVILVAAIVVGLKAVFDSVK